MSSTNRPPFSVRMATVKQEMQTYRVQRPAKQLHVLESVEPNMLSDVEDLELRKEYGQYINYLCCSPLPVMLDLPEPNSVHSNKYIQQFHEEYITIMTTVLCAASRTPGSVPFDIVSLFRDRTLLLDTTNTEHTCSSECYPFRFEYGDTFKSVFTSIDGEFRQLPASGRIFICATTGRCHYCTSCFQRFPLYDFVRQTCVCRFNGEHTICELSSYLTSDFVAEFDDTDGEDEREEANADAMATDTSASAQTVHMKQRDNEMVARGVNALVEGNREVSTDELAALQRRVQTAVQDVGISRVEQMKFAQEVMNLVYRFLGHSDAGKTALRQHSVRRETESQIRAYAAACAHAGEPMSLVMCMQIERTCVVDSDGTRSTTAVDHDVLNRQVRKYARCVLIVHRMWSMTLHNTKPVVLRDMVYAVLKIMHDGGLWIEGVEVIPHDSFLVNMLAPVDSAGVKSGSINIMVKRVAEAYTAHLRGIHRSKWTLNTISALLSAAES